jgi:hypothetical protein
MDLSSAPVDPFRLFCQFDENREESREYGHESRAAPVDSPAPALTAGAK